MDLRLVFGMIFTIILIGFLLVYGSGAISNMFCVGSEAQVDRTVKQIESMSSDLYALSSGSSKVYKVSIPDNMKICFVTTSDPSPKPNFNPDMNWNPENWEQTIIQSKGYNVWYYACSGSGYGYTISRLYPESGSFCAVSGTELLMKNMGASVSIQVA